MKISYSQFSQFKASKKEWVKSKIFGISFQGNDYTDFGINVEDVICGKETDNHLNKNSLSILKEIQKLDQQQVYFETKINEEVAINGYIDDISEGVIRDYKTGGAGKQKEYNTDKFKQLDFYSLDYLLNLKEIPKQEVVFIQRNDGKKIEDMQVTGWEVIERPKATVENLLKLRDEILQTTNEMTGIREVYNILNNQK